MFATRKYLSVPGILLNKFLYLTTIQITNWLESLFLIRLTNLCSRNTIQIL